MTFLDLWTACRSGDQRACEKIIFWYWEYPRLERILKKLTGGVVIAPLLPSLPGPDPGPEIDAGFLRERAVVQAVLGDPNPQPNIFPHEVRLKTTIALRDAMTKFVESLKTEIEHLERDEQKK